jgi:signal transduction histidine kinase
LRALSEAVRYLSALTFTGLTVVAGQMWWRRHVAQGRWAVLTFASLSAATLQPLVARIFGVHPAPIVQKVLLLGIVGFPYFLYRFTMSFGPRRPFARSALAITLLVAAATLVVPFDESQEISGPTLVFVVMFTAQWCFLSLVSGIELWKAGAGQPMVARRRMRTLSLAATGLVLTMLIAIGSSAGAPAAVHFGVQLLGLLCGILFFLGFAPPSLLRVAWRQSEQQSLQEAMLRLMGAATVQEVTDVLLPHVAGLVGGERVELLDARGATIATYNRNGESEDLAAEGRPSEDISLSDPMGLLRVWTTPYTPFFGRDEVRLLHAMGAIADLALGRTSLLDEERRVRSALERTNDELTNANVELGREVAQRQTAERSLIAQAKELVDAREEAERANRAKSDFLSRMSHELRTPLNAILGFGQLLEMEELPPNQRESVAHVLKAGRHLLGLINEVLEIAKIEAGRLTVSTEAVSVMEVIGEALVMARPLSNERSITIETPEREDIFVLADRQRLKQVLLNLLSNAIKYNRDHGRVTISAERVAAKLRIDVSDTGQGIASDKLDRLFTPFERLGAEGSDIQGTGLGLALSKSLVEVMGGELSVESEPGEGSTFSIELPIAKRPTMPVADRGDAASARRDRLPEGATVLYIEDNMSNLRLVEQVLKIHSSARLFTAMQGRIGIDLARRHRPDIILLDLHLPDMDGEEVLRRLRGDERT